MGEYFKPWRRTFGIATLAMVWLFLLLWGQSLATQGIVFLVEPTTVEFVSNACSLALCGIPYWLIVIPLALLSGYLLLSKPRTKID